MQRTPPPVTSLRATAGEPSGDKLDDLIDALRSAFSEVRQGSGARLRELEGRIASLEDELRDTENLMISAEQQAARLASLYAASYQLHSLDPAEVRAAIREIAVDLLGARRCNLLLADDTPDGSYEIEVLAGATAVPATLRYTGGDALIDAGLADGGVRIGPAPGSSAIAVVPLAIQGRAIGALVVLELLPQKSGLHRQDRELLDLLAAHAASALVGARAFQDTQRKLRTLEGLVALVRGGAGGTR
jgi:GAF domain-containing protein